MKKGGLAAALMPTSTGAGPVASGVVLGLVFVSALLRLWGLASQLPLIDESNTVFAAVNHSFEWIRTHFGRFDHCIPLTLLYKLAIESWGLGEWTLRLPSAIAGILVVAVVGNVTLRRLRPSEAILATAAVALSPYLVYLSREGRPYPIVTLLFTLACLATFRWRRTGGRSALLAASGCGAFALWFHPIVAPAGAVLAAFVIALALRAGRGSERARDALWAAALAGVLVAGLLAPTAPSLYELWRVKSGTGELGFASVRHGLTLIHGAPVTIPIVIWVAAWSAGCWSLARRYPVEVALLCAMTAMQIAFVGLSQPFLSETSWVWIRYFAHLTPFLIPLSLVPLANLLEWGAGRARRPNAGPALASALALLSLGGLAATDRYPLSDSAYNSHPWMTFLPRDLGRGPIARATPEFYRRLGSSSGALIEAPMPISFPLYGIYQRAHGRPVYAGVVAGGTWQPAFVAQGLAFARIVDLEDSGALWPADAKYLVFHKDIRAEMSRMYSAAASIPELRAHLYPQEKMEIFWAFELGARPLELPAWLEGRFPRVYEDPFIEVYALDPPP